MTPAPVCIAVLAHQEERRIATCLHSLPLNDPDVVIHVVVNGSTDSTAAIARQCESNHSNVTVHVFAEGGKSRSWNRFVFDTIGQFHPVHIFVDGDAEVMPGSITALAESLTPGVNAASALPLNGRKAAHYRRQMRREHGLFGDLYAVSGGFLERMKSCDIRLPDDLVGDDGLVLALAKTDLTNEGSWNNSRATVCEGAGFLCEPVRLFNPRSWQLQYRRLINYSVRHFQNRMISDIMGQAGPAGLPGKMADLYPIELSGFTPRIAIPEYWFDRLALRRMADAISR